MLLINPSGQLVTDTLSGKQIPITGVRFNEWLYSLKCIELAITGEKKSIDYIIDGVIIFSTE